MNRSAGVGDIEDVDDETHEEVGQAIAETNESSNTEYEHEGEEGDGWEMCDLSGKDTLTGKK